MFSADIYAQTAQIPISDGQIYFDNFYAAPVALTVPEPKSLAILGCGLFGFAFWRRRQR
ncbi:MAG: PEP-CTERM sorting domain-containing protein [Verrucomicrobiota bacterium]